MSDVHSAFSSTIPEAYERALGPMLFAPYAVDMAARLGGARTVLEVAAGTGRVTRELLRTLPPDAAIVATDLNDAMIEHARTRVPADPRLEWRQADAMALPFADDTFDAAICQFGLMFVPHKLAALREFRRVLTPAGRAIVTVWGSLDENVAGRIPHLALMEAFPDDPPQFYLVPFAMADERQTTSLFAEAGFSSVTCDVVDRIAESASAELAGEGFVFGNPVILAIRERGTVAPETIARTIASRLASAGGESPCRLPMRARVFTAVK
jgi:ubiquinone/menaquinone biosynthesis C-methylase UbiE